MIFIFAYIERGFRMNQRPSKEEYAGDFGEYIRLVPEGNIIDILLAQEKHMTELLASLSESQGVYRYAEGKWTLKEVVGHITDGGTRYVLPLAPVLKRGPDDASARL